MSCAVTKMKVSMIGWQIVCCREISRSLTGLRLLLQCAYSQILHVLCRFNILSRKDAHAADELHHHLQDDITSRQAKLQKMADESK